jgi:hypothetical protein
LGVTSTGIVMVAAALMLLAALGYAWKHRPYRGPGTDTTAADEMAMRASKFTQRSGGMGGDIGGDL